MVVFSLRFHGQVSMGRSGGIVSRVCLEEGVGDAGQ